MNTPTTRAILACCVVLLIAYVVWDTWNTNRLRRAEREKREAIRKARDDREAAARTRRRNEQEAAGRRALEELQAAAPKPPGHWAPIVHGRRTERRRAISEPYGSRASQHVAADPHSVLFTPAAWDAYPDPVPASAPAFASGGGGDYAGGGATASYEPSCTTDSTPASDSGSSCSSSTD